ncbi:MAG: triose-phosphate isomerase, partial [Candidatus Nealsonbacteria bacterium CG23_combo_of_CG06-09_8_20_14_all_36_125]
MKPIIVANWKCNPTTQQEAKRLFNLVKKGVKDVKNIEVVICSPFVYLSVLKANGAQDCF